MIISIYPDRPIWWKRVLHTFVLCSISGNIFLNQLNNLLYDQAEGLIEATNEMLPSASKVALGLKENVVPAIRYIENSNLDWIVDQFHIPDSKSLEKEIDNITQLEKSCRDYQSIFEVAYFIIWLTNILMWWPILFSARWLFQDLQKGSTKLLTLLFLFIAIVVNIWTYNYLNTHWAFIFQ